MSRSAASTWISTAVVSAAFLFLLWAASPRLLGRLEPWDTDVPVYTLVSIAAGFAITMGLRGRMAAAYVGAWGGQVLAIAVLPGHTSETLILGVFSTAIGSTFFLFGAAAAALVSRWRAAQRKDRS